MAAERTGDCLHCGLPVSRRLRSPPPPFCCFGCRFAYQLARPAGDEGGETGHSGSTLVLRLGLGIFLALNIMVFSWLGYAEEVFGAAGAAPGLYDELASLFEYLVLFLASGVLAALGLPLLQDALTSRRLDANLLILIGVAAAFTLSLIHTLQGAGSLYYDTVALLLVIATLGRTLEAGAKRRASIAARPLLATLPARVRVRRAEGTDEIAADSVEVGDRVLVAAASILPVDGVVRSGRSRVEESSLTGESEPRAVGIGDQVLAGTLNTDGLLEVEARRVGRARTLAQMESLLERARHEQPPIQRQADRIAALFVPSLVVLAVALFLLHAARGSLENGLMIALSVLLISCPCALGLAAPLAVWNALRRAAERGILIDSGGTLERAAAVDRVLFDKTGTLTESRMELLRVETDGSIEADRALLQAAALETASRHPIALSLVEAAAERRLPIAPPSDAESLPGLGVAGTVDESPRWLGGEALIADRGLSPPPSLTVAAEEGASPVYLLGEDRVLARFDLRERLRPDAAGAVGRLRDLGVGATILTGDRAGPARAVARVLGLDAEHGLLPADKLERLLAARGRGTGRIAVVGDGINDAPLLAAADLGIAVGSASDLAKVSGNVRLTSDRLLRIPETLEIARHALRRIRLNLLFSFAYNSVGVALAAAGLLSPVVAAVAMVLSSLTVILISRGAGDVAAPSETGSGSIEAEREREPTLLVSPISEKGGLS